MLVPMSTCRSLAPQRSEPLQPWQSARGGLLDAGLNLAEQRIDTVVIDREHALV